MKKILVIASMMLLGSSGAWALTTANTQIQNAVSLSYTVDNDGTAVAQENIDADDGDGFVVDRRIDVLVDEKDTNKTVKVIPGTDDQLLHFDVTNEGNDDMTYDLTAVYDLGGDQFDPTTGTCAVYKASDTATAITTITIAQEATEQLVVKCNIPTKDASNTVLVSGNQAFVSLKASIDTAAYPNDTDGDAEDTVENVYADGHSTVSGDDDGDNAGDHADRGIYEIETAELSATKESCVLSDPLTRGDDPAPAGYTAHRIPGAYIQYAIEVSNTSTTVDADNVTTDDELKSEVIYRGSAIREGACDCTNYDASDSDSEAPASTSYDAGDHKVTLNFETIEKDSQSCAYIQVEIN